MHVVVGGRITEGFRIAATDVTGMLWLQAPRKCSKSKAAVQHPRTSVNIQDI
jgi:hypothetical protein